MAAKMLKNIGRQDSRGMNMIVAISEALFGNQGADGTTHTSSTYLIVHYVLRLIILILCLVGCFAQIGTIVRIYFSYPAIVFVDLHQMEKLLLPAFTICNENRVMSSKLREYDVQFAKEWKRLVNQTGKQSKSLKLYQQQLIDNLIRTMLTNLTVSEFMNFCTTAEDFLDVNFFRCASDKSHPNQRCITLSNLLTTAQENGNCFTLFHKSNSTELDDIAINSGLSESAVVRGTVNESVNIEMSLKPFAPNEIIRFRVNFHENEYTTLNEPVSGHFIIHDNRELVVIREKSYRIEPGKYYIFYITKSTDELLPAPYFTDCRDYTQNQSSSSSLTSQNHNNANNITNNTAVDINNYSKFNDSDKNISLHNLLGNSPSSKSNCIVGCIARKTIQICNCWPPELPFLYDANGNSSTNLLRWCDWRERPPIDNRQEKPAHLTWFQYCFNVHEEECNRLCKSDCSIDRYQITKEEIVWPSLERIERSDESGELRQLRQCCAVISIRYWTAEQKINKYKPRFELAEFTSYIGGLLSMWLGFSLFGFYGLSERSIVRLANYCLRRRKRRASRVPLPERKQKSRSPRIPRLSGIHNLVADAKTTKVQDVLDRGGQTLLTKQLQMLQQNEHEK